MVEAAPNSSDLTFRLIYRSHSRVPADHRKAELGAIFSVARSNNKDANITGALLVSGDWFVQALEGEEAAVRALYDRIVKDARHERVAVIDSKTVDSRVFARWAMAKVATEGEPDIPLITNVNKGGITPAGKRPTTPEQDAVLDFMRGELPSDVSA